MRLNSDSEEVMEHTQILHSKLLLKSDNDVAEKWLTGGCEDNIINIKDENGRKRTENTSTVFVFIFF
jgi:hypothetical protein